MNISDVRIVLSDPSQGVVLGYVTVVFEDCFLVRNLRILKPHDNLILAMPNREVSIRCQCGFCGATGNYCSKCGAKLPKDKTESIRSKGNGRFQDLAHPICSEFRARLEHAVFETYLSMVRDQRASA